MIASTSVRLVAARQLEQPARAAAIAALPSAIAGLLGVVPGSSVTLLVGSEPGTGIGLLELAVAAPADAAAFAAELAAELAPAFTTRLASSRGQSRHSWAVRGRATAPAGFGSATTASTVRWEPEEQFAAAFRVQMLALLSLAGEYPGLRLEVTVSQSAEQRGGYRVWLRLGAETLQLPLRARAIVQSLFADLRVDGDEGGESVELATSLPGVIALLQPPVAGELSLPGLPVALARPIPVLPVYDQPERSTLRLGSAVEPSGRVVDIHLTPQELPLHRHVVGKTGTGKSTLLAAEAHGYAVSGNGCLVIDPHGHLGRRILAELPEDARERVWYIEAGDLANPVPLNPFALEDEDQLEIVIQDIILIFYRLFDPKHQGIVGPRFETILTKTLRGLREVRGVLASLLDVPRVLRDAKLERHIASSVSDPELVDFWRGEMRGLSESSRSEIVGWFTSKFDRFSNTAAMRGILGTGADAFDPAVAMDEGRIIILDLSKGSLGEVASNMLGFLYLTRFWSRMGSRRTTRPFGFIVDEVQSFSAGSLPALLSEGRKFGACVTVAHQYLSQLEPELADALAGNVATMVAFRTGVDDARAVATRIGGDLPLSALTTQPDLQAILSRTSGSVLPQPHTLLVDHGELVAAREGVQLEAFIGWIRAQTHRDLVDPHRGAQRFTVPPPARVGPPPGTRRVSSVPNEDTVDSSFLDDWLKRRADAAAATVNEAS